LVGRTATDQRINSPGVSLLVNTFAPKHFNTPPKAVLPSGGVRVGIAL